MAGPIETSGDIEIYCYPGGGGGTGRVSVSWHEAFSTGDRLALVFNPGDHTTPPYSLKIFSPSGKNIVDTVVRELPTGQPQSPPPIEFVVSAAGMYRIEIKELRGRQKGEARVRVD
ncbi:MAG: hypothetical protein IT372_27285 [Polyangiaceae bacterium]|nr:hypothetical protein [Polyangiaceae bacterium]